MDVQITYPSGFGLCIVCKQPASKMLLMEMPRPWKTRKTRTERFPNTIVSHRRLEIAAIPTFCTGADSAAPNNLLQAAFSYRYALKTLAYKCQRSISYDRFWSPLSPSPLGTTVAAFLRRSALKERLTLSCEVVNCPWSSLRTYRLSPLCGSMSSRLLDMGESPQDLQHTSLQSGRNT